VTRFYQPNTTDNERKALLDGLKVVYVFWGPQERTLGGWDPHQAAYLTLVYEHNNYAFFRYTP
jgi:hypothetical protein